MHRFVLVAGALAATVLTACSGGGIPQAVPGTHPGAPARRTGAQIHILGAHPDANCPKTYSGCITVNATSGGSIELCYGSCGGGHYTWSSTFSRKRTGAPYGRFLGTFAPNPGNPVTDTVTELKPVKASQGRYRWYQTVTVCGSGCVQTMIGIATT
ncbi:MAG: hypothetical protein WB609_05825 [Candidatus Cybelea sp.]